MPDVFTLEIPGIKADKTKKIGRMTINGSMGQNSDRSDCYMSAALTYSGAYPVRTNWYATQLSGGQDALNSNGISLTAIRKAVVKYNPNGGQGTMSDTEGILQETANAADNQFTRSGYSFAGWNTKADGTGTSYKAGAAVKLDNDAVTLFAQWTKNAPTKHTVTFHPNNGQSDSTTSVENGSKVSKPTDPTRDGYKFDGWYTDSDLKNAYDFSTPVTSNLDLYAKWTKEETPVTPVTPVTDHTVTFHPSNGQSDFTQTVADGNKVSQPADPVQDGYTFNGWYTDSALTNLYDFDTPVTSDLDLYAKWTKNTPAPTPVTPVKPAKKITGILLPKVIANGSSRQTLTWTPLTNVDGYYVYEANCNTPKPKRIYHFKKVADVSASSPRVYKRSGLKKGVAYKYCVAAYKIKNGKKKIVKTSVSVHSVAGNLMKKKTGRFTNVQSVRVKKNAVTLKVGKTYRIQPSVRGVVSGCAILQKDHAAMFRYLYIKTGKNISVSQNGVVRALKAGKCNVYVLGTNGVRTKVAVTVVK
jgi:uncharacterized repeat protein (TIGR02543 family)